MKKICHNCMFYCSNIIGNCEDRDKFCYPKNNLLFDFFLWFRENGEKYIYMSIEKMIDEYLKSLDKLS